MAGPEWLGDYVVVIDGVRCMADVEFRIGNDDQVRLVRVDGFEPTSELRKKLQRGEIVKMICEPPFGADNFLAEHRVHTIGMIDRLETKMRVGGTVALSFDLVPLS